jgi:DNA-binding transcriptional LysR family regulator
MTSTNAALTPELCRTFVALAQHEGSVTAAARELGASETSVSKRIRPLVRGFPPFLPRPWLIKRGKRFHLTDEGRAVLPLAAEQAERWRQFTAFAAAGRMPGMTVACGQEAAGGVVLKAATTFRQQNPQSVFRIAVVRGSRRIEGVANGLYDIALVTHSPAAVREIARRDVIVEQVSDDELVLACAAKSPWYGGFVDIRRPVTLEELLQWPLALPEPDAAVRRQWDERMRRHQLTGPPTVAIEVGGWRTILGYVLAGFGVGMLPKSLAQEAGPKLKSRPLPDNLRPMNRLYSVRLPESANPELLESFCRCLVS